MGNLQGPPEQDWDQMDIEEILRLAYEENTDDLERRERMVSIPASVSHESGGVETEKPGHGKPGFRS